MRKKRPVKEQAAALQLYVNTQQHNAIVNVNNKRLFNGKKPQPVKPKMLV